MSHRSARAVGLTIDARSSVPGLDIPQIWQCFAPGRTSAPQRLQRKARAKVAPPRQVLLSEIEHSTDAVISHLELSVAGSEAARLRGKPRSTRRRSGARGGR